MGDSVNTNLWGLQDHYRANGTHRCNILRLTPLLDEVMLLKLHFDNISFSHVYREINTLEDRLSKEGA